MKPKIYIIEPSKVGYQHIGLLRGYLKAFVQSKKITESFDIIFMGSITTNSNLKREILLSSITFVEITVIDPHKRRFISKTVLEAIQVIKMITAKKKKDVILVTCLLPTSLILVELANLILKRNRIYIVLHGEIESISQEGEHPITDIGFWSRLWLKTRSRRSKIRLIVLGDFIKDGLRKYASKIEVSVLTMAVESHPDSQYTDSSQLFSSIFPQSEIPRVCFIGFRTKKKGFNEFEELATQNLDKEFVAIGDGFIESISFKNSPKIVLKDNEAYLYAIQHCCAAIFAYTEGYSLTLSSAAMDAIAQGVPIIALDRPFFRSLNQYFGATMVDIKVSLEDISRTIQSIKNIDHGRRIRSLQRLSESKYSIKSLSCSIEDLFINE